MKTRMQFIRKLTELGWSTVRTRGGHIKLIPPLPDMKIIIMSASPSDHHAFMNARADIRRAYKRVNLEPPL